MPSSNYTVVDIILAQPMRCNGGLVKTVAIELERSGKNYMLNTYNQYRSKEQQVSTRQIGTALLVARRRFSDAVVREISAADQVERIDLRQDDLGLEHYLLGQGIDLDNSEQALRMIMSHGN